MGYDEIPYLVFGAYPKRAGKMRIHGVRIDGPTDAVRQRCGPIRGNRDRDALWQGGTALENVTVAILGRFFNHGYLERGQECASAETIPERNNVVPQDINKEIMMFSGGN